MTNTVRLKFGDAEIELSSEENLENSIKQAMDALQELSKSKTPTAAATPTGKAGTSTDITINTAVARLGGGTCKELMIAAAALLGTMNPDGRFTRQEWSTLAEESNQWKSAYANQRATIVRRLVASGYIIENSKHTFSLSADARADLEARLGAG